MITPRLPSVTQLISDTGADLGSSSRKTPPLFLAPQSSSATPSSLPSSLIALPKIQQLPPSPSLRDATASVEAGVFSSSSSIVSTSPLLASDSGSMHRSHANGYIYSNAGTSHTDSFSQNSRSSVGTPDHLAARRDDANPLTTAILPGGPLDTQLAASGSSPGHDQALRASQRIPSKHVKENYRLAPTKPRSAPYLMNHPNHNQQPLHLQMRQQQQQIQRQPDLCQPVSAQTHQMHQQHIQQQIQQQQIQQQQIQQQHLQRQQIHQQQIHQQQMHDYQRHQHQLQQQMYRQQQQGQYYPSNQSHVQYGAPMPQVMVPRRSSMVVAAANEESQHIAHTEQFMYQSGQPQYTMLSQQLRHSYPAANYAPNAAVYRPAFEHDFNSPSRMSMYARSTSQQAQMNVQNVSSTVPGGATPNHRRVVKRRTRTGCFTCRQRRIKCDERKPFCMNCERSKKCCLGYDEGNDDCLGGQTKRKSTAKNGDELVGRQGATPSDALPSSRPQQTSQQPLPIELRKVKLESDQGSRSRTSGDDYESTNPKRARPEPIETPGSRESPSPSYHLESISKRNAINDLLNDEDNRGTNTMFMSPPTRKASPDAGLRVSSVHKLIEQSGCVT